MRLFPSFKAGLISHPGVPPVVALSRVDQVIKCHPKEIFEDATVARLVDTVAKATGLDQSAIVPLINAVNVRGIDPVPQRLALEVLDRALQHAEAFFSAVVDERIFSESPLLFPPNPSHRSLVGRAVIQPQPVQQPAVQQPAQPAQQAPRPGHSGNAPVLL